MYPVKIKIKNMNKLKHYVLIVPFFILAHTAFSQVFLGGGYATSVLSQSGLDDVNGWAINIQKDYKVGAGRWHLIPALQISLLNSNIDRDISAFYATTVSVAPIVSYDLFKSEKFIVAPYIGPFAGWLAGVRSGDILVQSAYLNELIWGAEFGLAFQVNISDDFQFKLIPINVQYGNEFFRQGTVELLFKL